MNRYKITFNNGQTLLLYGQSQTELNTSIWSNDFGGIKSIDLYTDNSYLDYIEKIKAQSEFLGYDFYHRECYKCSYYKGYLIIKFSKDKIDNTYYDLALYQEHKNHRILEPLGFIVSDPKEVYNIINAPCPKYIIYSHRYYGQPKLSKPKELKGIKPIGKATYIPKHCEPQVFIKENDVYIKHTDYFSYTWRPPEGERIDMPISYYMSKYFNETRKEKFVYPDGWGSIILRNEAWILLKDILQTMRTENYTTIAQEILELQKKNKYSPSFSVSADMEWIRFWENVCRCVKENYLDIGKQQNDR